VAVKDFYDTAGVRTTAAFEPFRDRVPARDAAMVVRLREAGAVLLGKTNMHKLGMGTTSLDSAFRRGGQPWSAEHVAGGSSGGSDRWRWRRACASPPSTPTPSGRGGCRLPSAG
jgi:aspartyl-tRNA(Asn)/glutamyl-tRNA(Gln) amidotransferase subunit A